MDKRLFQPGGPPRYAHQQRGLRKMIATRGVCALLFDPGMGKTAVVLDFAGLLAWQASKSAGGTTQPSGETRILVVCPLAAIDTWVDQAALFVSPDVHYWAEALGGGILEKAEALAARGGHPHRKPLVARGTRFPLAAPRALRVHQSLALGWRASAHRDRPMTATEGPDGLGTDAPRIVLEVVNIDTFASRMPVGSKRVSDVMLDAVVRFDPDLVVVDESHKIKSATGNASRLMARIGRRVRRRVILTGTVMPHSPVDVFGQWHFLAPYAFGSTDDDGVRQQATEGDFKARYVRMGGFMGLEVKEYVNLDEMREIMAANAIVARKSEALDLPPTTDVVVPVRLSVAERKAYRQMKNDLRVELTGAPDGPTSTAVNRLARMMRLRQITSGHLPLDVSATTHDIGTSKADTICSIVHDTLAGEKRIVVFCFFSREIDQLCRRLARKGTEVMRIEGDTPTATRTLLRKRFGTDPEPDDSAEPGRMVIVAQVKTLSLAVNELVTANHAIFGSLSQQRDDLVQARDRLDRIGQTRPVTFWFAVARGTVDEVILKSHAERTNLEAEMLRHIREKEDTQ